MDLHIRNNELVGLPDGYKLLFLAKTIYCDAPNCFIVVIAKEYPTKTEGETNYFHRILPEAIVAVFDANGNCTQSSPPYSAKEYIEKDALRVIEFEPNGRTLRWTHSKWDPDRGARVEYRWCEFLGRRIDPRDIFIAL